MLLVALVGAFVESVLVAPVLAGDTGDATTAVVTVIGGTIGGVLTAPFSAAVVAFLYFDQRVRKEGFDAHTLAEGVGDETETEPEAVDAPDDETRWLPPRPPSATP